MPDGRIHEEDIARELAANKACLQGFDHLGQPVLVVLARRHDMSHRNLQEAKRFIAYILDNVSAAADLYPGSSGKILCLFDLSGLRMKNLDAHVLKAVFEVLQGHFPERLSCLMFLNAPVIFWGLWRIVSPFIHPDTRAKIRFVGSGAARQELLRQMPADVLPQEYGGSAPLRPIQEVAAAGLSVLLPAAALSGGRNDSCSSHPLDDLGRGFFWRARRLAAAAASAAKGLVPRVGLPSAFSRAVTAFAKAMRSVREGGALPAVARQLQRVRSGAWRGSGGAVTDGGQRTVPKPGFGSLPLQGVVGAGLRAVRDVGMLQAMMWKTGVQGMVSWVLVRGESGVVGVERVYDMVSTAVASPVEAGLGAAVGRVRRLVQRA